MNLSEDYFYEIVKVSLKAVGMWPHDKSRLVLVQRMMVLIILGTYLCIQVIKAFIFQTKRNIYLFLLIMLFWKSVRVNFWSRYISENAARANILLFFNFISCNVFYFQFLMFLTAQFSITLIVRVISSSSSFLLIFVGYIFYISKISLVSYIFLIVIVSFFLLFDLLTTHTTTDYFEFF